MVRTKDELITALKEYIGENNDDKAIALLEDVTDTVDDYETKISDPDDWKKKFEENDKAWRKKYTDRFSAPVKKDVTDEPDEIPDDDQNEGEKELTFENLFKSE
jgi:hypothetical protein